MPGPGGRPPLCCVPKLLAPSPPPPPNNYPMQPPPLCLSQPTHCVVLAMAHPPIPRFDKLIANATCLGALKACIAGPATPSTTTMAALQLEGFVSCTQQRGSAPLPRLGGAFRASASRPVAFAAAKTFNTTMRPRNTVAKVCSIAHCRFSVLRLLLNGRPVEMCGLIAQVAASYMGEAADAAAGWEQ